MERELFQRCDSAARVAGRPGFQKLFLAINKGVDVLGREVQIVTVRDGIGGAGLHAIAAKNAARVVNVVRLGVTLTGRNALRFRILGGLDVDAVRRTSGSAQEAGNAFLESIFIALQDVNPAIAGLYARRDAGIILRGGLAQHVAKGNAEAPKERYERLADFTDNRWHNVSL